MHTIPGADAVDELLLPDGAPRYLAEPLWSHLIGLGSDGLVCCQAAATRCMHDVGVTFAVSDDTGSVDRPWPFDIVPRLVSKAEWSRIEAGLAQRLLALNLFVDDAYHQQHVVRAGVLPPELVSGSPGFRPGCVGVHPPGGIWTHICGSDLVRDADGTVYVLEDNLRVPSGVSYMMANRQITKRILPELFRRYSVEPLDGYVQDLGSLLSAVAPVTHDPVAVVLTPGPLNAAYFEHVWLAQELGATLVEAGDMVVDADDVVSMRTIAGLRRVDVVYRRVDDLYLDPETFRRDSVVGVPGLMRAWRAGTVALVNAPGAGIADDKALYGFVPELIRFYLGEEPILANVPTFWCGHPEQRRFVLANLASLVIKPAGASGGYGVVIGPAAGAEALALVRRRIAHFPEGWVAQPVVALSTVPTVCEGRLAPRHVDLRPFTLVGPDRVSVTQGGLTRVARQAGSLIVNSSQGGGSKDTWVVDGPLPLTTDRTSEGTLAAPSGSDHR